MASGDESVAPIAPIPPPLATAIAKLGGQAPAMGASMMGIRNPKRWQKDSAVFRASVRLIKAGQPL